VPPDLASITPRSRRSRRLEQQAVRDTQRHRNRGGSAMNVQPLADRILVRRIEEQETIRGGIIIPDTAKEKPQEGEVVAVGPGRRNEEGKRIEVDVKKGDRVLIGKYSGTDVKIEGTEFVILREDEILGILNK
jgi:chaperonin GroES